MSKLSVINGLRGVAILGVIYHHLFGDITGPGWHAITMRGITLFPFTILSNGWQGVTLFFFLSGFVLALPYVSGRRMMHTRADAFLFYRRRAARLLPLYFISVFICILFRDETATFGAFLHEIFSLVSVTFVFQPSMFMPVINWVLWTLGIEILFSVLFPFVVVFLRRFGMFFGTMMIFILSFAVRIIGTHFHLLVLSQSVFGRLDDFAAGMLLAFLFIRRPSVLGGHRHLGLAVFFLLASFLLADVSRIHALPFGIGNLAYTFSTLGFFFLASHALRTPLSLVRSLLSARMLQMIGLMCYSLYVWHGVAMSLSPLYDVFHFVRYIVVVFTLSFLTYRYIEFGHEHDIRKLLPAKEPSPH